MNYQMVDHRGDTVFQEEEIARTKAWTYKEYHMVKDIRQFGHIVMGVVSNREDLAKK